jgi:hypothetical protein
VAGRLPAPYTLCADFSDLPEWQALLLRLHLVADSDEFDAPLATFALEPRTLR